MKENSSDQSHGGNSADCRKESQTPKQGRSFVNSFVSVSSCNNSAPLRNLENLDGGSPVLKKELEVDFKDVVLDELLRETSVRSHSASRTPAEADVKDALIMDSTSRMLNDLDAIVGRSTKVKNAEVDAVDSKGAVLEELFQVAFPARCTPKQGLAQASDLLEAHCKLEAFTPPPSQDADATTEGEPNDALSHTQEAGTDEATRDSSSPNETSSTGDASSDGSTPYKAGTAQSAPSNRRKRSRSESPTPETYRRTRCASQGSSSSSGSPPCRRKPTVDSESSSDDGHRLPPRRSPSTDSASSFSSVDENPERAIRQRKREDDTSRRSPCLPTMNAPILKKTEHPTASSKCDEGMVPVSDDSDIEVLEAPIGLDRSSVEEIHVQRRIRDRPSRCIERAATGPGRTTVPSLLTLSVRPPPTTIRPIAAVPPFAAQFRAQPVSPRETFTENNNPLSALLLQPIQHVVASIPQRSSTVPEWLRKDVPPSIRSTFVLFPTGESHDSKHVDMLLLGDDASLKPLLTCTDVLFGPRSKYSSTHPVLHHYFTVYASDDVVTLKPCVHALLRDLKPASFQRMWASIRQTLIDRFASIGSLPRATFHFIDQPTRNHQASVRKAFGDDVKPSWYETSSAVCAKIEELDLLASVVKEPPAVAEWTRTLCGSIVLPRQLSFRTDHLRRLPSTCAPSVASALFKLATWMNWDLLSASKVQASGSRKLADFTDTVIANDEQLRFLAERFAESTPKLHQFLDFVHRLHAVSTEKLAAIDAVDSQCAIWLRRRLAFEQAMRGMSQAIRDVVESRDSVDYEDLRWFAERAGQLMTEVTA